MKNLQFLLVLLAFISCRNTSTNQIKAESKTANAAKTADTIVKPAVSNTEYIDFDEIRINGQLPVVSKTDLLYKILGKPDSVIVANMEDVCVSFYEKPFKEAYIKNTAIEIYGDTTVLTGIDFKSNHHLEFTTKNIRLNYKTTLLELGKMFPNTVKSKSDWDIQKSGDTVIVRLATSKQLTDDAWLLLFEKGKLIRIDYYMPC